MKYLKFLILSSLSVLLPFLGNAKESGNTAYDFEFVAIDGKPLPLADYKGKVLLVANTASECGFVSQFEGLERLWKEFASQGLVVVGVPSNDFKQESKNEKEIKRFCEMNFGVTFPLTGRNEVTGEKAHPFFKWIDEVSATPRWNFYKYLIGKDGKVIDYYSPLTNPESSTLKDAIKKALAG